MGTPPSLYRGRMPVFCYLSVDEAADVYLYLTLYPPESAAPTAASIAGGGSGGTSGGSADNHTYSSSALSESGIRPISLVQFAFFPCVLFLFFAVLGACLPLAVKSRNVQENSRDPSGTTPEGNSSPVQAGVGGKLLRLVRRNRVDRSQFTSVHIPRR